MTSLNLNDARQERIRWTILALSILSFIFSVLSVSHCTFMLIGSASDDRKDMGAYGLYSWGAQYGDDGDGIKGCIRYAGDDKDEFGAPEKTARAFGAIAALLTCVIMLIVILLQLFVEFESHKKHLWLAVRILFPLAMISQLLTFVLLASDGCKDARDISLFDCTIGAAGIIGAFAAALLAAGSVLTFLVGPPSPFFILKVRGTTEGGSRHVGSAGNDVEHGSKGHSRARHVQYYHSEEDDEDDDEYSTDSAPMAAPKPESVGTESVQVFVTEDRDGTKKTTRVVTQPDGTKTITTTTEAPKSKGQRMKRSQ